MSLIQILQVAGSEADEWQRRKRGEWKPGGLYPFIIGTDEVLEMFQEVVCNDAEAAAAAVAESLMIDGGDFLAGLKAEGEESPEMMEFVDSDGLQEEVQCVTDFETEDYHDTVNVALVRLDHPWELVAVLGFGGFNGHPDPPEMAAVFRLWEEKYGAEVVVVGPDMVECRVARPVTDKEEAIALALEMNALCPDIVAQGTETIGALAGELMNSPFWFFWWD